MHYECGQHASVELWKKDEGPSQQHKNLKLKVNGQGKLFASAINNTCNLCMYGCVIAHAK